MLPTGSTVRRSTPATVREFHRLATRQGRDPEDFLPRRLYRYDIVLAALLDRLCSLVNSSLEQQLTRQSFGKRSDDSVGNLRPAVDDMGLKWTQFCEVVP